MSPAKVYQIFVACCTLHDMAISRNIPVPMEEEETVDEIEYNGEGPRGCTSSLTHARTDVLFVILQVSYSH